MVAAGDLCSGLLAAWQWLWIETPAGGRAAPAPCINVQEGECRRASEVRGRRTVAENFTRREAAVYRCRLSERHRFHVLQRRAPRALLSTRSHGRGLWVAGLRPGRRPRSPGDERLPAS